MSIGWNGKSTKNRKTTGWRPYSTERLRDPHLWKPGDPLTEKDQRMLEEIRRAYKRLGRVPAKKDVSNSAAIKSRFRLWSDALQAAGLPRADGVPRTLNGKLEEAFQKGGFLYS